MGKPAREPFHFYTRLNQTELLGMKAANVSQLLGGIETVPDSSIYHHTHRSIQRYHYISPARVNDFAWWITEVLSEAVLGEKMGSADIIEFQTITGLRQKFIQILQEHLSGMGKSKVRNSLCPTGREFHFMKCRSFFLPTPYIARQAKEFREMLKKVSVHSLYFHVFEARLRLGSIDNDFSRWLRDLGEVDAAEEIAKLDPYTSTLEGLREKILAILDKRTAT